MNRSAVRSLTTPIKAAFVAAVAAVAVLAVGASAAVADTVPAHWTSYQPGSGYNGGLVFSDPANPFTVKVGNDAPIVCSGLTSGAHSGTNVGDPEQAQWDAELAFACDVVIELTGSATADTDTYAITMDTEASLFTVKDAGGTWRYVNGAQFSATYGVTWGASPYKLTVAPNTLVGTTTVGGLPVTVGGTIRIPGGLAPSY